MITRGFLVDILLRCCGDYRVIRVYKALGDIVFCNWKGLHEAAIWEFVKIEGPDMVP